MTDIDTKELRELLKGDMSASLIAWKILDEVPALLDAADEREQLMAKWAIESDESLTECVERNIDGWKKRCLKAEKERDRLNAENERLRYALTKTTVSLLACISLMEQGGRATAPSDLMYAQMVNDYKVSATAASAALEQRP